MILVLTLACWSVFAQRSPTAPIWDSLFRDSWTARLDGDVSKAGELSEKGWNLVQLAGPGNSGYADGVEQAYATSLLVFGLVQADKVYSAALKITEGPSFALVRLDILVRMATRFSNHQEVRAKTLYEQALQIADSLPVRPRYYGHILDDFAELSGRMGDLERADELRARAADSGPSGPAPYPRFGLPTDPSRQPQAEWVTPLKTLQDKVWNLISQGDYEEARAMVDDAFALVASYPRVPPLLQMTQMTHFGMIATAYCRQKHFDEAAEVLQRHLAICEKNWGEGNPDLLNVLIWYAWVYIKDVRQLKPAHELTDRAEQVVIATSGEISDRMREVEELRLRLAQLEKDAGGVSEHTAQLRKLWVAIHGENTKPLVIP